MIRVLQILIGLFLVAIFYKKQFSDLSSQKSIYEALKLIYLAQGQNMNNPEAVIKQSLGRCLADDTMKLIHPDVVLSDFYFYRQQAHNDTVRLEIRKNYFDAQPFHEVFQSRAVTEYTEKIPSKSFSVQINAQTYNVQQQTSQFCLSQMNMHFPQPNFLDNKVQLAQFMNKRLNVYKSRNASQQCLKDAQFQKKSYILDDPIECREFFKRANVEYKESKNQQEILHYVKKNNLHSQRGTELAFRSVMKGIQQEFEYGNKCNAPPQSIIMQEYINNPMLIKGRKIDMRIHIIAVSTHPLILYLFKSFYFQLCLYKYDHKVFKNQSHICTTGYQMREMNDPRFQTKEGLLTFDELNEHVPYEQFADYLIAEGKISDRSWIDTHMIPEMEKKFYHYFQTHFDYQGKLPDPRIGEYKACDFNLDDELNFYLLECTPQPNSIPQGKKSMLIHQTELHLNGLRMIKIYQREKFRRLRKLVDYVISNYLTRQLNDSDLAKLRQKVAIDLQTPVIVNEAIDKYFHRVDIQRAAQSCN